MSIQPCNCYTSDPKPPYFKDDNYYCATCDKGMGNAYFAAASDRDRALADLAKERERAEDVFKDNVRLCAEKTRVWVENASLRAELAECRAELASACDERDTADTELAECRALLKDNPAMALIAQLKAAEARAERLQVTLSTIAGLDATAILRRPSVPIALAKEALAETEKEKP